MAKEKLGEALIEVTQIGNIARVSAIDTRTNTEVTIQGPASAGRVALTRAAMAKLNYVLSKKAGGTGPQR